MAISVSELKEHLPPFDEVTAGDHLTMNNESFRIESVRTEQPSPGEVVRYFELTDSTGEEYLLSFAEGHTVETVYYHHIDEDPMTGDLVEVEDITYLSE